MQIEHTSRAPSVRSHAKATAMATTPAAPTAALEPGPCHPPRPPVLRVPSSRLRAERGQGLTEYAVLVSLVAVACIAAMAFFGGALQARISTFVAAIAGESASNIEDGNKKAQSASTKVRQRTSKIDGMKVNTDKSSGEVIDSESLQ